MISEWFVEVDTRVCLDDFQEIAVPPQRKTYPVCDLHVCGVSPGDPISKPLAGVTQLWTRGHCAGSRNPAAGPNTWAGTVPYTPASTPPGYSF